MKKPKFTPGPWYIKPAQHMNGALCHCVCYGDDEIICETETDDMPNSLLIASAPEMYDAMAEFVRRVDAGEVRSKRTYARFKAILAKINGGE